MAQFSVVIHLGMRGDHSHGGDENPLSFDFACKRICKSRYRDFGTIIRGDVGRARAGEVDDPSAFALDHAFHYSMGAKKHASKVDFDIAPPFIGISLPNGRNGREPPRVVDENIDCAEFLLYCSTIL